MTPDDQFALVRVRFFEGPTQLYEARLIEVPREGDLVLFPSGRLGSVKAVVWDLTDDREDNARLDMAMEGA